MPAAACRSARDGLSRVLWYRDEKYDMATKDHDPDVFPGGALGGRDGSGGDAADRVLLVGNLVLAGDTDTGKIERVTRDLLARETLRQEQVGTRLETMQRQMDDRLQALEAEAVTAAAALKQRIADLTERLAAADARARAGATATRRRASTG